MSFKFLNNVNISDTKAPFLDLHLSVLDGLVSSEIFDKRDDFDIVNFPLHKAFSKFYRRHFELVSKYKTELRSLLQQGLLEHEYYVT